MSLNNNEIRNAELSIFSIFQILFNYKYFILFFSVIGLIASFLYYTYSKKEYYQLLIGMNSVQTNPVHEYLDVASFISKNYNVLLGLVLYASDIQNTNIIRNDFITKQNINIDLIPKLPMNQSYKNYTLSFYNHIKNKQQILDEISIANLQEYYKIDDQLLEDHLNIMNVTFNQANLTIVLDFKSAQTINIKTVDAIINAAINIVLRDVVNTRKSMKKSILSLMDMITDQYYIDLNNRIIVLKEKYENYKNIDYDTFNDFSQLLGPTFDMILGPSFENPQVNNFFPETIQQKINTLSNRKNHEPFIPGKSILKNAFNLIDRNIYSKNIESSLNNPGYLNDEFQFLLFNSPKEESVEFQQPTSILKYLIIGTLAGLFFGFCFSLLSYIYNIEKEKFIDT